MSEKIKLFNRYGDNVYLEKIDDNLYNLCLGDDSYLRAGYNADGSVAFVDPSGGPFLGIEQTVNSIKGAITHIQWNKETKHYEIKFDDNQG